MTLATSFLMTKTPQKAVIVILDIKGVNMHKILQVDFPFNGPFGKEMAKALSELARSITAEPGFIWKIWTENKSRKEAGGIYFFESEETAATYLEKHTARLKDLGVSEVRGRIYDINVELSKLTAAPIAS